VAAPSKLTKGIGDRGSRYVGDSNRGSEFQILMISTNFARSKGRRRRQVSFECSRVVEFLRAQRRILYGRTTRRKNDSRWAPRGRLDVYGSADW